MTLQTIDMSANNEFTKLKAIDLLGITQELEGLYLEYRDTLNLERKVRFGIELEYEGLDKSKVEEFIGKQKIDWKSEEDITLKSGGEAVSPKLFDQRKTWEDLRKICEFLRFQNADTTHNAGVHIHVGAHLLGDNLDAWRRFAKLYTIYERVLIRFGYGDKVNARRTLFSYAKPVALSFLEHISELDERRSLTTSKNFFRQIYNVKENAINLRSLEFLRAIVNFNTLEFRYFNSTTEEAIIQNDVNVACHMLLAAASKDLDEDFLNFKLRQLEKASLNEKAYLEQCSQILLREMAELVDLIFDNNKDKIYFMKQYIRSFETSTSSEVKYAREMVKK